MVDANSLPLLLQTERCAVTTLLGAGCLSPVLLYNTFFFQAEDGIRDTSVTGVQTCALPISVQGDRRSAPPKAFWSAALPTSSSGSKRLRRRRPSIALNRPADTSHARGFAGTPDRKSVV